MCTTTILLNDFLFLRAPGARRIGGFFFLLW
nr:MAG TPA: hypothetical protein [Caudoviricetes sp.]